SVARPVPRHWHEEYQLCLVQSGSGELRYRGEDLLTPPASLFIVQPGEVHSNRAYGNRGCSYRDLFVGPELMRSAASEIEGKERGLPFFKPAIVCDRVVIRKYLDLHLALERPSSRLERDARFLELIRELLARFAEERPAVDRAGLERRAVTSACDYLVEHYAENVSLETLARMANLSPFHFNRVFSEQKGMPPHAFQTQLRVARAKELLREGCAIPQVAAQTGFADQSHLTRYFKRLVGVPPGRYMQNRQYTQQSKNVQDTLARSR
ncbi:MAG TPA: AraC family transcriptional regulator, partial [Blastocatellia bacterium]|nr:AraC family transcriptional regulator [Blastocatellia bacterium]